MSTDPFFDWQDVIVPYIAGKDVVEYGLGDGTAFLLQHAADVFSVEMAPTAEWWKRVRKLHGDNPRWHGQYINADKWDSMLEACVRAGAEGADVAFVDHALHCRPETVNALFGVVPCIVAHDTSVGAKVYHWERLKAPADYKKAVFAAGNGTTVWERLS